MSNIKGLSNIVAVVLIILISITSLTLIYSSVSKLTLSLSPEISCLDIKLKNSISIDSACFDSQSNLLKAVVSRKSDNLDLENIIFSIQGTSTQDFSCGQSCNSCNFVKSLETKTYYFNSEEIPISISINSGECLIQSVPVVAC